MRSNTNWVQNLSGNPNSFVALLCAASDSMANTFVVYQYSDAAAFTLWTKERPVNIPVSKNLDSVVLKLSPNGVAYWKLVLTGAGIETIYDITTDSTGNTYFVFVTSSGGELQFPDNGRVAFVQNFVHLVKIGPDGSLLWKTKISHGQRAGSTFLATDRNTNDVVILGSMTSLSETVSFYSADDETNMKASLSSQESTGAPFFAKYSSSGDLLWIAPIFSNGTVAARAVNVDKNGNIYISCSISHTATYVTLVSPGKNFTLNPTFLAPGGIISFLAKYDSNGIVQWVVLFPFVHTFINCIQFDSNSDVLFTGYLQAMIFRSFNSSMTRLALPWIGSESAFFAKYYSNGTFGFAARIDGPGPATVRPTGTVASDWGRTMQIYPDNSFLVCGDFYAPVLTFDSVASNEKMNLTLSGVSAGFCGKYSADGIIQSVTRLFTNTNDSSIILSSRDDYGNVVLGGRFLSDQVFLETDNIRQPYTLASRGVAASFIWLMRDPRKTWLDATKYPSTKCSVRTSNTTLTLIASNITFAPLNFESTFDIAVVCVRNFCFITSGFDEIRRFSRPDDKQNFNFILEPRSTNYSVQYKDPICDVLDYDLNLGPSDESGSLQDRNWHLTLTPQFGHRTYLSIPNLVAPSDLFLFRLKLVYASNLVIGFAGQNTTQQLIFRNDTQIALQSGTDISQLASVKFDSTMMYFVVLVNKTAVTLYLNATSVATFELPGRVDDLYLTNWNTTSRLSYVSIVQPPQIFNNSWLLPDWNEEESMRPSSSTDNYDYTAQSKQKTMTPLAATIPIDDQKKLDGIWLFFSVILGAALGIGLFVSFVIVFVVKRRRKARANQKAELYTTSTTVGDTKLASRINPDDATLINQTSSSTRRASWYTPAPIDSINGPMYYSR